MNHEGCWKLFRLDPKNPACMHELDPTAIEYLYVKQSIKSFDHW